MDYFTIGLLGIMVFCACVGFSLGYGARHVQGEGRMRTRLQRLLLEVESRMQVRFDEVLDALRQEEPFDLDMPTLLRRADSLHTAATAKEHSVDGGQTI